MDIFRWRSLALQLGVLISISAATAADRVWVSPEGCPLSIFRTSDSVRILNTTSGEIRLIELGCVKTTRKGLVQIKDINEKVTRNLKPREALIDGPHAYRQLELKCLDHSAAVSPTRVEFGDGKQWNFSNNR